jgi:predicted lysophospholipase L1 biosynthesis ABC-type transport system permease subunit
MKTPSRRPLDFSLTEPPAVLAAAQGAVASAPAAAEPARATRKVPPPEVLKQLNTRIPASTHRAFKIAAMQEGISVQDLLARLIDRHLAECVSGKS